MMTHLLRFRCFQLCYYQNKFLFISNYQHHSIFTKLLHNLSKFINNSQTCVLHYSNSNDYFWHPIIHTIYGYSATDGYWYKQQCWLQSVKIISANTEWLQSNVSTLCLCIRSQSHCVHASLGIGISSTLANFHLGSGNNSASCTKHYNQVQFSTMLSFPSAIQATPSDH